jgi:RNA polymerase sigma factor (sigma-70 family)
MPEEMARSKNEEPEKQQDDDPLSKFESFANTEHLVERYQKGDPRAADRLFFRLRGMLLAVIRDHASFPFLPPTHSAEDVLQDLWTVLFERDSLRRFRSQGSGSLRAFLRRCLDRTMIGVVRKGNADKRGGGVRPEALDAGDSSRCAMPPPRDHGQGPATQVAWDDWEQRCERVLHGKEREVWKMHFVLGFSYARIAKQMTISEAAVRAAYHRALGTLKDSGLFDED